jgi:hypothetical protein
MPRQQLVKIRKGSTAPAAVDFQESEPAWDSTNGRLYIKNAAGTMVDIGLSALADGDKGHITVSGSGLTWTIDNGVVTDAHISASAEIAVSKLANGTARQIPQTDAAGTGVEWTSNIDLPGTLDVQGQVTFDSTFRQIYNSANVFDGYYFASALTNNSFLSHGVSTSVGKAFITSSNNGSGSPLDIVFHIGAAMDEAARITKDGVNCRAQSAPVAANTSQTLTIATLKAGIVTTTATNNPTNLTLPTGTLCDGGFSPLAVNLSFDWVVINTGTNAAPIVASTGHTIVGAASTAGGTTGRFRSRRTGTNTWVTYRV